MKNVLFTTVLLIVPGALTIYIGYKIYKRFSGEK